MKQKAFRCGGKRCCVSTMELEEARAMGTTLSAGETQWEFEAGEKLLLLANEVDALRERLVELGDSEDEPFPEPRTFEYPVC